MVERPSRIVDGAGELSRPFVPSSASGDGSEEPSVEELVTRARDEGLRQGHEEGRREAREAFDRQATELRAELVATLKQLCTLEARLTGEFVAGMKQLALEAASRIARARIDEGEPVARRALEEALEALPGASGMQARLHPVDLESIRDELADEISGRQIELLADETVARGGCVVSGGSGTVDATIETAERAVRSAVEDPLEAM